MIFDRVWDDIEKNRQRRLDGKFNCIPWGLPRFEEIGSPGIQQGKYYCITASSKIGKSQVTDHLFLYNAYNFVKQNKSNIKLKIFYFSLEMSKEEKLAQAISNKLYTSSLGEIRVSPTQLKSVGLKSILSDNILKEKNKLREYFEEFEDIVTYIDNIRNPFGIYDFIRDYAEKNGQYHKKKIIMGDKEILIEDYYEPNNTDEYVIIIVDHAGLLQTEKGGDIRDAVSNLSSNYFIKMRNRWNYIPVLIQQQAASQESNENAQMNKLRPTLDGLGTNKNTQQDANIILGLFSPYRHKISTYEGYDIVKYKDHIRFLEILGGREGGAGVTCPLYFDGAVNYFRELPLPNDTANLELVKRKIEKIYETTR